MSANHKQKLELTWIGKGNRPKLEPRILLEDAEKSYHAQHKVTAHDIFDNRLVFGDNLLALKALEQEFTGKIKCIYIDPPYNTGQAFEHYDDGIEHSLWLSLMRDRLELLHRLLAKDGVIFVQLNDEEFSYCKVLMDEIFGRSNFINQIAVKTKNTAGASGGGEDKRLKKNLEFILVYVKDQDPSGGFAKFNEIFDETDLSELIDDMEADRKSWKYTSILLERGEFSAEKIVFDGSGEEIRIRKFKGLRRTTVSTLLREGKDREEIYKTCFDAIFSDTNAQTSIRTRIIDEFKSLAEDEILEAAYVPRSGRDKGKLVQHLYISQTIRRVIWLKDTAKKRGERIVKLDKLGTLWSGFNWNNVSKEGQVIFPNGKKPEALIKQVLDLATSPGDCVLDSFAGSGTTGAVAHKMGRRWIMVELEEHCHTHIIPRLKKVIDGTDQGGITKSVDWKGGGGFRYFRLAPSLLEKDKWGNWVMNREYNAAMLAEAVCKLEGFIYDPSETVYWQHGYSTERDFIYVTTQTLRHDQLQQLSDEVGEHRSLLVMCAAFRDKPNRYSNLTIKKIPQAVLARCEWGHDEYSLQVENLPKAPLQPGQGTLELVQDGGR